MRYAGQISEHFHFYFSDLGGAFLDNTVDSVKFITVISYHIEKDTVLYWCFGTTELPNQRQQNVVTNHQ